MSEEYTVVHQWDKTKSDFKELMGEPYKYVETELKKILKVFETGERLNLNEYLTDFRSVVEILEKLNSIYKPKYRN